MTTHTRARPLAGALTIALGALGVLVGTAAGAQAAPATVTGGTLDWGVKESFRDYITGPIAHGSITPAGGATSNADGTIRFPSATGTADSDADTAELAFGGTVTFSGHDSGSGPLLFMTVSDIRVQLGADGGTLVADVVSKSLSSGENVTYDDVEFADLAAADLTGTDTVTGTGIAATLTEPGAPAFADFYAPGTALDPVSFAVTTAPAPTWEPAIAVSRTTGVDPAGETLTVTGSGFDPTANVGTRPPLAGQSTGVYLVFAELGDPWRPSEGAPPSARTVLDQKWVLPAASRAVLDPAGTNQDYVVLGADGTFTGALDVAACTGTCGIVTYAAGGATNAAHELFVPLTFADADADDEDEPTTPPATTPPPSAEEEVTGARLEWGVKESFRNYVRGPIAHGSWALDGVTGDGPFRWENLTEGTFDPGTEAGLLDFAGSVRFTGHDGLLDLTLSQPQVRVTDGTAELLLNVRSKGLETPGYVELDDAVFASLDLDAVEPTTDDGVVTYTGVPAALTAQGAEGFAGFYPEGTELDPLTFTVAMDGATLPPPAADAPGSGGSSPAPQAKNLAYTGVDPAPMLASGVVLVLLGTGLLLFRRRPVRL
ncbi:HtaA domain-containing protein [Actinophytocola gossypii]|uniref:HtaA domain-containing protein n=1 Tax=Actinophytocola gossypii TaxID=2812003 RepID=A0ABT2JGA3_9PSEU|nr:HtaA domain-containing protein [Actinophytocola gossypii]MCT2586766.1 HtaA domain-containing protein [Actinophytocola gossypii]